MNNAQHNFISNQQTKYLDSGDKLYDWKAHYTVCILQYGTRKQTQKERKTFAMSPLCNIPCILNNTCFQCIGLKLFIPPYNHTKYYLVLINS